MRTPRPAFLGRVAKATAIGAAIIGLSASGAEAARTHVSEDTSTASWTCEDYSHVEILSTWAECHRVGSQGWRERRWWGYCCQPSKWGGYVHLHVDYR